MYFLVLNNMDLLIARLHCSVTEHKHIAINGSNKKIHCLIKCHYLLKEKNTTVRGCSFGLFKNSRIVFSLKIPTAISANVGLLTMLRFF